MMEEMEREGNGRKRGEGGGKSEMRFAKGTVRREKLS